MFDPARLDTLGDGWLIRWRGSQRVRHRACVEAVRPLLAGSSGLAVLDIGCAQSQLLLLLRDQFPGHSYVGADISKNAVDWNRTHHPSFRYVHGALPSLNLESSTLDLVCALEVIYYLDGDERSEALLEIARLLKPGGHALLSVPLHGMTEEELLHRTEPGFRHVVLFYNHAALCSRVERHLVKLVHRLLRASEVASLEDEPFAAWLGGRRPSLALRVLRLNPLRRILPLLSRRAAQAVLLVLRGTLLPSLAIGLTRTFAPKAGRSHVIVLAAKR
ncbi:MAG: methyltransferase domain-containing protein [Deltaproteobacteria bacterium]|nr:methyltransferase domain-containing protein [Deltaproteobacteria bacterium]